MNKNYKILSTILVLTLASMACGLNLSRPVTQIETSAIQGVELQVPPPKEATGVELNLEFVGGELKLAPGGSDYLASGMATFNATDFKPVIETSGPAVTLRSGDLEFNSIPVFGKNVKNEWDLKLANTPISLKISAGAYDGNFELGGLSLEELALSDGGANVTCAFSNPNNVVMSSFTYSTGASTVNLKGLANANFEQMIFNSGAGSYTLSFDGDLQRDANVTIESGVGTVTVIVPEGANAKVSVDGLLTIDASGAWTQNDKVYTLPGSGPAITITVKMGAGTLNLKTE